MITADLHYIETEVKLLTVILAFSLSLPHGATAFCRKHFLKCLLYGMVFFILWNVLCAG